MPDVYRVGVSIIAGHNTLGPALTALGAQMLGLQRQAGVIGAAFGGWGRALGAVGAVLAAGAIVEGLVAIAKAGAEVNKELSRMKISGMTPTEIEQSYGVSRDTAAKQMDTSLVDNLRRIRELRAAFGDTEDAEKYLGFVNNAQTVINAMGDGKGGDKIWELVKSGEMKGLTQNPEQFKSLMEGMVKANVMSGGKITPADFFGAFKYGRSAMYGWDEDFITKFLPTMMMEYKGGGSGGTGGPGNALMSMYSAIVAQRMTKGSAQELGRLGLLTDTTHPTTPGTALGKVSPNGVTNTSGFMSNPYQWVQDTLVPALQKANGGKLTQEQLIAEISKIFQVRTASSIADLLAIQGKTLAGANSRIEKDAHLQSLALPGGMAREAEWLRKNDISTVMEALSKQFQNLGQVLGSPMMAPGGPVVQALASLVGVLGSFGQFTGDNIKVITGVATVIADIVGVLASVAGRIGGGIAQFIGISGVFQILASIPWERLHTALTGFITMFSGWVDSVIGLMDKMKSAFGRAFTNPGNVPPIGSPMSFNPGTQSIKAQPISLSLNVDGRTLAQTISQELEYLYEHPTGAPSYNGGSRHIPTDSGLMGT